MEIPYLDVELIEEKASNLCRQAFGDLPTEPVDLEALLFDYLYEEQGLAFYCDRPLGRRGQQDILGITYPLKNEIHVDSTLARSGHRGRYRFTVAHEIGHWVLHRPLFLDALDGDKEAELVTFSRDVVSAKESYRPEEWQANQFAIFLLLNDPALQIAFEKRFGPPPVTIEEFVTESDDFETLRQFSRHLAEDDGHGDLSLADFFELSAEATAIALEERGYVVENGRS